MSTDSVTPGATPRRTCSFSTFYTRPNWRRSKRPVSPWWSATGTRSPPYCGLEGSDRIAGAYPSSPRRGHLSFGRALLQRTVCHCGLGRSSLLSQRWLCRDSRSQPSRRGSLRVPPLARGILGARGAKRLRRGEFRLFQDYLHMSVVTLVLPAILGHTDHSVEDFGFLSNVSSP